MKNSKLLFERKFGYENWTSERIDKAYQFAEGYRQFISGCKTEREVVNWVMKKMVGAQFIAPGKGVCAVNRGKSLIVGRYGRQPLKNGVKIILAHIDSPRIDLKPMPLYESEKMAWFKTQYYGGIKKYQWPAVPLAIHGVISLTNGKNVILCLGEEQSDAVFTITDLLPHLAKKQMEKKLEEAVGGEEMNIVIGSIPSQNTKYKIQNTEKNFVKLGVLELLNKKYGITEEDLVSADLEIVPAGGARNVGFDGSLIGGYGQDDRVCAYTAINGLLQTAEPQMACLVVLTDKEETGSESNTGAMSNFTVDFISEMLFTQEGKHDENTLRDCLSLSKAISADVTVGFDPDYKEVFDPANTARIGAGIAVEKYCGRGGKYGTNEATAEYLAYIRNIFNKNNILWQTGGLGKVDEGGGGTIAMFLARHNLDVVDAGPPILSMHSPFEVASKVDIYACFEAYKAFFQN